MRHVGGTDLVKSDRSRTIVEKHFSKDPLAGLCEPFFFIVECRGCTLREAAKFGTDESGTVPDVSEVCMVVAMPIPKIALGDDDAMCS